MALKMRAFQGTLNTQAIESKAVIYVLAAMLILAPMLLADVPGMADYPNHLARMSLLTDGSQHPAAKFYEIVWFLTPNLAMDIIIPVLGQILGVEPATRAFLLLSMILIMTGSMAIEYAINKRVSFASLFPLLFTYNAVFLLGFLNFLFSLGLALWAIAAWIALRQLPLLVRGTVHFIFVPILFVSHLHGFAIYFVAIGAYEAWYLMSRRRWGRDAVFNLLLLAAPFVLVFGAMELSPHPQTSGSLFWDFSLKARFLATLAGGYNPRIAVFKAAGAAVLVLWAWRRGALWAHPAAKWIAGALALAFVILPHGIMGSFFGDIRFMVAALFIIPAFISWHGANTTTVRVAAALYAVVLVTSVANVAWAWSYLQQDYHEIRQSFALLKPQAKILLGRPLPDTRFTWEQRSLLHAPTLAVAEAGAFVPTLFTWPGSQVIRARPEYRHLDVFEGWPIPVEQLMEAANDASDPDQAEMPYWHNWTSDFDYLYIMFPTANWTNPMPETLTRIASGREFVLYRIGKAAGHP